MIPTLASLVEERMKDDPDMTHDVIHALNQWMYETWSFNYQDRIFSTPIVTLPIVERALEELEWRLERGARTVLVRPAPVPGYRSSRSPGFGEFDPFWQACIKAGIPVTWELMSEARLRLGRHRQGERQRRELVTAICRAVPD
jgi:predicted TIM-barrel fold metal-dependent hydrolase